MRVFCCALALAVVGAVPVRFPDAAAAAARETGRGDDVRNLGYRSVPLLREHERSGRQQFFKEQNAYTRAVLDRLGPAREKLFERIKALDNAGAPSTGVTRDGPYYFYEKLNPGDNSPKLYVRNVDGSEERVLIDPQASRAPASTTRSTTSCRRSTAATSRTASPKAARRRRLSTSSRRRPVAFLPDAIIARVTTRRRRAGSPTANHSITSASRSCKPGEPETDKETRAVNYLHVLGRDPDQDVAGLRLRRQPEGAVWLDRFSDRHLLARLAVHARAHRARRSERARIYAARGPSTRAT